MQTGRARGGVRWRAKHAKPTPTLHSLELSLRGGHIKAARSCRNDSLQSQLICKQVRGSVGVETPPHAAPDNEQLCSPPPDSLQDLDQLTAAVQPQETPVSLHLVTDKHGQLD